MVRSELTSQRLRYRISSHWQKKTIPTECFAIKPASHRILWFTGNFDCRWFWG